ncbi:MAG TPA: hypothetical protein EYP21_07535 [Syntrophaceae bacterium]|nr:hypothetical protein [Syntrophaceae bacterium]
MTVVFMDTNSFVRYFTNDILHLAQGVQALIERAKHRNIINEALAVYVNKNIDYVDAYTAAYMKDRNLKKLCSSKRR